MDTACLRVLERVILWSSLKHTAVHKRERGSLDLDNHPFVDNNPKIKNNNNKKAKKTPKNPYPGVCHINGEARVEYPKYTAGAQKWWQPLMNHNSRPDKVRSKLRSENM